MEDNSEDIIVRLNSVPIKEFVEVLTMLMNKGANMVDLLIIPEETQNTLALVVKEEYVDKENNQFTKEELSLWNFMDETGKLSEDDLTDIIS